MSTKLLSFLIKLTDDYDTQASYRRDPKMTMLRAGISALDQEAILSKDGVKIRSALNAELAALSRVASSTGQSKLSLPIDVLLGYT